MSWYGKTESSLIKGVIPAPPDGAIIVDGNSLLVDADYIGIGSEGAVFGVNSTDLKLEKRFTPFRRSVGEEPYKCTFDIAKMDRYDTSPNYPVIKLRNLFSNYRNLGSSNTILRELLVGRWADFQLARACGSASRGLEPAYFLTGIREWFVWTGKPELKNAHHLITKTEPDGHATTAAEFTNLLRQDTASLVRSDVLRMMMNKGKDHPNYSTYQEFYNNKIKENLIGVMIMRQPRVAKYANQRQVTNLGKLLDSDPEFFGAYAHKLKLILVLLAHELHQLQHVYGFIHGDLNLSNIAISHHGNDSDHMFNQLPFAKQTKPLSLGSITTDVLWGLLDPSTIDPRQKSICHLKLLDMGRAGFRDTKITQVHNLEPYVTDMTGGSWGADMRRVAVYIVLKICSLLEQNKNISKSILLFCANVIALPVEWLDVNYDMPCDASAFAPRAQTAGQFFETVGTVVEILLMNEVPDRTNRERLKTAATNLVNDLNPWTSTILRKITPKFNDPATPQNVINFNVLQVHPDQVGKYTTK